VAKIAPSIVASNAMLTEPTALVVLICSGQIYLELLLNVQNDETGQHKIRLVESDTRLRSPDRKRYLDRTQTNEYSGAFSGAPTCSWLLAAFLHSSIEVKLPTWIAPEVPSATQIINRAISIGNSPSFWVTRLTGYHCFEVGPVFVALPLPLELLTPVPLDFPLLALTLVD
jgi:hypothetical protein